MKRLGPLVIAAAALAAALPPGAHASGPPQIGAVWANEVNAGAVRLHGELNPEGSSTSYRFEYATDAAFREKEFLGAIKAPSSGPVNVGSGSSFISVSNKLSALHHGTLYHYRLTATNGLGTTLSSPETFTTQEITGAFSLPDNRGWEMVSPPDKNGGAIQGPEQIHGGGILQAAASGEGAITYSSTASFGGYEAQGSPPASQYISARTQSGWTTQNITPATVSGSYGNEPNGVPYQLFSPDLAHGLMLNGIHCRDEGTDCPIANPPLPGSGAPEGFQDYYLRDNRNGTYTALLTEANAERHLSAPEFNLALAGASPDLSHLVLSTCAALTPGSTEVPGSGGCDPTKQNLYEYSAGQLSLVNSAPGAELAAQSGAVSADGSHIYFTEAGKLYLREGSSPPHEIAAGGEFQIASSDGTIAFYTKGEHLFRYDAAAQTSTDLTPTGEVRGVLGAAEDGLTVYFQSAAGLQEWHEGALTQVAAGPQAAQPSDYPPTTGSARVSPDGERLLFLSSESLTGYDNHDATTGQPDSEVYLWNAAGGGLICISCNPTNERPSGPSTISGAYTNGRAPGSTDSYKPRNLSTTQDRAFFDSEDSLVALDTNKASDVYEWEAQGTGSCQRVGGCISMISNGKDSEGATFVDASESGSDVYFLTSFSLDEARDPGSRDIYDARVGGGFPEPESEIECIGDACVPLPQGPEDPTVGSLIAGLTNPPAHFPKTHQCPKGTRRVIRHDQFVCLRQHHKHHSKRNHKHHSKRKGGHR